MNSRRSILFAALALVATAQSSTADPPPHLRPFAQQQEQQYEESIKSLPLIPSRRINDLFQMRMDGDHLALRAKISASSSYASQRAKLDGIGSAIVVCTQLSHDIPTETQFEFILHDYPTAETSGQLHILARPEALEIDKSWQVTGGMRRVMLQQGDGRVMLNAFTNAIGAQPESVALAEKDFATLRRLHPRETEEWLRPLFRQIHQVAALPPDVMTAWQVLSDDVPEDAATVAQVARRVRDLGADDFRVRWAAASQLEKLGRGVTVAIARTDRHGLSLEQDLRLDEIASRFRAVTDTEATALRNDCQFLLDCLYCPDAEIRRYSLSRLRKLTGKPLEIDLDAPADEKAAALDALRNSFTGCTTRPSE